MDYVREQLLDEVRKFFVGPRSDNDPIPVDNMPLDVYTAGILFPKSAPQDELDLEGRYGEDSKEEDAGNDEESEKFFKQSSIGIRARIEKGTERVRLVVNYGKYAANETGIWERCELDCGQHIHELDFSKSKNGKIEILDDSGVAESKVFWTLYGGTVLNVFLENAKIWSEYENAENGRNTQQREAVNYKEVRKRNNMNSIFQPSISLHAAGDKCPFKPMSTGSKSYGSKEDDLFDLLYRGRKVFGSGYGCAVEWENDSEPEYVRTTIIPSFQDDEIAKFAKDTDDPLRACTD